MKLQQIVGFARKKRQNGAVDCFGVFLKVVSHTVELVAIVDCHLNFKGRAVGLCHLALQIKLSVGALYHFGVYKAASFLEGQVAQRALQAFGADEAQDVALQSGGNRLSLLGDEVGFFAVAFAFLDVSGFQQFGEAFGKFKAADKVVLN